MIKREYLGRTERFCLEVWRDTPDSEKYVVITDHINGRDYTFKLSSLDGSLSLTECNLYSKTLNVDTEKAIAVLPKYVIKAVKESLNGI